jgi:hypothetical protein
MAVSICLDRISIETLDLETGRQTRKKYPVSTVKKISTLKKVGLDTKESLDLDWSRLSRPPGLKKSLEGKINVIQTDFHYICQYNI